MWLQVALLLAVSCACLTYDVSAHMTRPGFPNSRSAQERRPGQGVAYTSFRDKHGRLGDRLENRGRADGFPWLYNGRKSNTAPTVARPDLLSGSAGTETQAGQTRHRRDYGSYFPGAGLYGPRFGGYGPAGDFGTDYGYGNDNFRRE